MQLTDIKTRFNPKATVDFSRQTKTVAQVGTVGTSLMTDAIQRSAALEAKQTIMQIQSYLNQLGVGDGTGNTIPETGTFDAATAQGIATFFGQQPPASPGLNDLSAMADALKAAIRKATDGGGGGGGGGMSTTTMLAIGGAAVLALLLFMRKR